MRSKDFDKASPVQLDLGVKIVSLLKVANFPEDIPDLTLSVTEKRLNIGPNLIPRRATIDFIVLVDGPCTLITHKNSLTGVELIQERIQRNTQKNYSGLTLRVILGYAAIAFILFFVIKDPTGAAHLINNIGNFLSSLARGFSAFFSSL